MGGLIPEGPGVTRLGRWPCTSVERGVNSNRKSGNEYRGEGVKWRVCKLV